MEPPLYETNGGSKNPDLNSMMSGRGLVLSGASLTLVGSSFSGFVTTLAKLLKKYGVPALKTAVTVGNVASKVLPVLV